jgi:NADH-quinone oxidoreductase subunit L
MTHAFFKALLFLGAGSVIIAMHHEQDMRYMGGLRRYMPITYFTMLLGTLALTGMPGFAGFFSKDAIIEAVKESHRWGSDYAYLCVLFGVFVTALYSFRLFYMTFHGQERFVVDHGSHDHHDDDHHHHEPGHLAHPPHESPWVVTVPLILLAIPSVLIGWYTVGPMLHGDYFGEAIKSTAEGEHAEVFASALGTAFQGFIQLPFLFAISGFVVATWIYLFNPAIADRVKQAVHPLWKLLDRKYWFDEVYQAVFARGSLLLGRGLWKGGDVGVIDNIVIDGSAATVGRISATVRWVQSGYLYTYAFAMILGLVALLGGLYWVVQ